MSDPTGNALRSAQSSGGEFFEDIDACAALGQVEFTGPTWEMTHEELKSAYCDAAKILAASDAREARLLALVAHWRSLGPLRYKQCAFALEEILKGDS